MIEDRNSSSAVFDQIPPLKPSGRLADALPTYAEHAREELMRHSELLATEAVARHE